MGILPGVAGAAKGTGVGAWEVVAPGVNGSPEIVPEVVLGLALLARPLPTLAMV
jgi:hypothetical protein